MSRTDVVKSTTHFESGISNLGDAYALNPLYRFGMMDPTHHYYTYFDDFFTFQDSVLTTEASDTAADEWKVTIIDTDTDNAASQAILDEAGGVLSITNNNNTLDSTVMQKRGESFLIDPNRPFAFKARIQPHVASGTNWWMGLSAYDTTPLDSLDCIMFQKPSGSTINFSISKGGVESGSSAIADASANWQTMAFVYTPPTFYGPHADTIRVWFTTGTDNGDLSIDYLVPVKTYTGASSLAGLTDTEMTITFGVLNAAIQAQTMQVDYISASFNASRA